MKLIFVFLMVCLLSLQAWSWGQIGHRVVGEIAQKHLSKSAAEKLKKILGNETLAQISTWPDFIRSDSENWGHTFPWHYVSMDKVKYQDIPKNEKGDIIFAMVKMEEVLRSVKASKQDKRNALAFLVHFVGDIHQPFHAGYSKDRGGNKVELKWFAEPSNLHKVWDENLVEMQKLSYTEFTTFINHVDAKTIKIWRDSTYVDWAEESRILMVNLYPVKADSKYWAYEYNFKHNEILKKRLLQGGVRLAGVLEKTLLGRNLGRKQRLLLNSVKVDYSKLFARDPMIKAPAKK